MSAVPLNDNKKTIRVLHVVHSLRAGGMENGVVNGVRALQGRGFAFTICCLTESGAFAQRLPPEVPVIELRKQAGLTPAVVVRLAHVLRKFRPDVVHSHNWAPLVYTLPACRLSRVGRILHGEHAQLSPEELRPRRLWARRMLCRLVDQIHTVSYSQKHELVGLGIPEKRVEAVVNGVDVHRFAPPVCGKHLQKKALGLPEESLVLGMVGRFGVFKRHLDLLDAFEKMALRHPTARLLLVGGGGPLEQQVRSRVLASPFQHQIHMAGFMQEPLPAYQAMDLLLVPSLNEGLSNAALEAMATGVPVLAHDACGNAELLGEGDSAGWVRHLGTVDALHRAMSECLSRPALLKETGARARIRAERCFGLESMVKGYQALYSRLAAHGGN
jgi:glycosyltransferase involved in cell wall biosynthesis